MNKIGFKNFRRFEKFEELEYNGIAFLVGRNNAGKSTLVKALLLVNSYLKSSNIDSLSFGNNILEDANIVTYGRAKYNKFVEDKIDFDVQFGDIVVALTITGDDDKSSANVSEVIFKDIKYPFVFVFDVLNKRLKIIFESSSNTNSKTNLLINDLKSSILEITNQITHTDFKKTSKEYIELNAEKEKLETTIDNLEKTTTNNSKKDYELETEFGKSNSFYNIVNDNIDFYEREHQKAFDKIQEGEESTEEFEILKAFKDFGFYNVINGVFDPMIEQLQSSNYAYVSANPVKQSALFAIRDKSNALAQAIHDFKQLNIIAGEAEHRFILKWMEAFDVGTDFVINMFSGEAYEMRINPLDDNIHLADKGMGSIQVISLIMKIACAIRRHNNAKRERDDFGLKTLTTIIIEEPELSLHPALQSLLADLFLDVYQRFGINFIIETHSEYILRRSQVLVAEKEFEVLPNENPFFVHYFPKEVNHQHYQLNYQSDGTFNKNFETGFFDTASLDTLKLLRLKRENKS